MKHSHYFLTALVIGLMAPSEVFGAAVSINWLDHTAPGAGTGVSFGVPWPQGAVKKDPTFSLRAADGKTLPVQTWPLAYWPDGSLKWSGLATATGAGVATATPRGSAATGATTAGEATTGAVAGGSAAAGTGTKAGVTGKIRPAPRAAPSLASPGKATGSGIKVTRMWPPSVVGSPAPRKPPIQTAPKAIAWTQATAVQIRR